MNKESKRVRINELKQIVKFIGIIIPICFYGQTNNLIIVLPPEPNYMPSNFPAPTIPYNPVESGMQRTMDEINRNKPINYTPPLDWTKSLIGNSDREFNVRRYMNNPRYYCSKAVNLRTGPGTNYPILANMEKYEYVRIIQGQSDWWEVYYIAKDKKGYVHKSLLVSDPSD